MVIVTTRNRDPAVWGTGMLLRELRSLDEEAAAAVLRDLAPGVADPTGQQARDLAGRLGGLPLALHLAGAYLASPFARWASFDSYRKALDSVELPAALRRYRGAGHRCPRHHPADLGPVPRRSGRRRAGRRRRPLLLVLSCYAPATPIPASLLVPAAARRPARPGGAGDVRRRAAPQATTSGRPDAERLRRLREGLHGLSSTGLIDIAGSGGPAGANAVTVHLVVADVNREQAVHHGPGGPGGGLRRGGRAARRRRWRGLDSARARPTGRPGGCLSRTSTPCSSCSPPIWIAPCSGGC